MSLYADYIREREGFETIEVEHGFATYKRLNDDEFYLRDICVAKPHRKEGIATILSEMIARIAREAGATKLIGSVSLRANGIEVSILALIGDGFKFSHSTESMLYFVKDI